MNIPISLRANVATPPTGTVNLFLDSANANSLTYKDEAGLFFVIGSGTQSATVFGDCECACELAKEIIEAANCALEKGTITAAEYTTLVNGVNITSTSTPNQQTGACTSTVTSTIVP